MDPVARRLLLEYPSPDAEDGASSGRQHLLQDSQPSLVAPTPRRHLILSLLCLSSGLSAFQWIFVSPIQPVASDIFAASALEIDVISVLFFALYLPASVLGIWIMERYGLRTSLIVGAALNIVCAALKTAAPYVAEASSASLSVSAPRAGYALLVAGQVAGAIAQPLILNPVPRLSADWYPEAQRDLATVVATQANVVGQVCGSLIPPLIVTDARSLGLLGVTQVALCAVVLLLTLAFVVDRPANPPSEAAARQWAAAEAAHAQSGKHASGGDADRAKEALAAMWRDTASLLRNGNFNALNLGFSIATGIGWTLLTVEAALLAPCGYDDSVAGDSGAALLALGVVTSLVAGPIMQRTRAYARLQKVVMGFCLLSTVAVLAANRPSIPGGVIATWLALGAGLQPLVPLSLEHAAEMTYPVPADVSSAILQTGANVIATVQTFALAPLLNLGPTTDCSSVVTPAAGFILAFMALGFVITLFVKPELRRSAGGKGKEEDVEEGG
jgi:hypothetical protein